MQPEAKPEAANFAAKIESATLSPEEFLTTRELMRLLKIKHRQTIYELISSGLPAILVGRSYRFIKTEVIDYLKQSRNHKRIKGRPVKP